MTQPRSRVDLYAAIRRDARSGMSNRALQRKYGVGFRTVTAALESAWPKERKQPPKRGSRLDACPDTGGAGGPLFARDILRMVEESARSKFRSWQSEAWSTESSAGA